ncbi:hypothetical protein ACP70R_046079 [Stipagrostis hirtigluma subsp. patula]
MFSIYVGILFSSPTQRSCTSWSSMCTRGRASSGWTPPTTRSHWTAARWPRRG